MINFSQKRSRRTCGKTSTIQWTIYTILLRTCLHGSLQFVLDVVEIWHITLTTGAMLYDSWLSLLKQLFCTNRTPDTQPEATMLPGRTSRLAFTIDRPACVFCSMRKVAGVFQSNKSSERGDGWMSWINAWRKEGWYTFSRQFEREWRVFECGYCKSMSRSIGWIIVWTEMVKSWRKWFTRRVWQWERYTAVRFGCRRRQIVLLGPKDQQ